MKVLFINNGQPACGVNDYGRAVFDIAKRYTNDQYYYAECPNSASYESVYHQIKPDVVLWNYFHRDMPWITEEQVDRTPARHIALVHLLQPNDPSSANWSQFHQILAQDPSLPATLRRVLPLPRPLPGILDPQPAPRRFTVGTFGFARPDKRLDLLLHTVATQVPDAIFRFHLPHNSGDKCSANYVAAAVSQIERFSYSNPKITTEITHDHWPRWQVVQWLSQHTINILWYPDIPGGVSSCLDLMIEANRPLALNKSAMFRHLTPVPKSVFLEDRTLKEIAADGPELLNHFREQWRPESLALILTQAVHDHNQPPKQLASNRILCSTSEITINSQWLQDEALAPASCEPKNWDLAIALSQLPKSGAIFDLGCASSHILPNAIRLGFRGPKYGMDLQSDVSRPGFLKLQGDFLQTQFPTGLFSDLICLSVLEHGVNIHLFAKEAARLLQSGGRCTISVDYWPEKQCTTGHSLFGLPWNIFSNAELETFIKLMHQEGLNLSSPMNWEVKEQIIRPGYHSPGHWRYTFACLTFIKE